MRLMRVQHTSTYEANFQRARKFSNAPSKRRARIIFWGKTFSARGSTPRFTFIEAPVPTFAEKKLALSNRWRASGVIRGLSHRTFQQCSASTCARRSSIMSRRSATLDTLLPWADRSMRALAGLITRVLAFCVKAVIPGGSSAKVLRADERFKLKQKQSDGSTIEREMSIDEIPMDFDSLTAAGSMAGSGGVIVLDDSRDMVWVLNNINEFYAHES